VNPKTAVVGLGRYGGGLGLSRFLLKQGQPIRLFDLLPEEELAPYLKELEPWKENLSCVFGAHDIQDFEGVEKCFLNPAVPWQGQLANELRAKGIELSSDIECFLKSWPLPVMALTGSNGKSTCFEMIAELLPEWVGGGNRGISVFDMTQENKEGCFLELSSFQLERIEFGFPISIVTTFTPDHLDQHGDLKSYQSAKERVSVFQKAKDFLVLGRGLKAWPGEGQKCVLGEDFEVSDGAITFEEGVSFSVSKFPLPGPHNRDLLALAVAAARRILKDDGKLQKRLTAFCDRGMEALPYRQNILSQKPYLLVNDSKATTPESSICAIKAFAPEVKTLYVICGGKEKDLEIKALVKEVKEQAARVFLIGEQSERWEREAGAQDFDCVKAGTLEKAFEKIKQELKEGDGILFSPGTSSFDQFRNFMERGECFDRLAKAL
jgi:UDP-N-acetylmuramoylalanine--D-glutamate ligase